MKKLFTLMMALSLALTSCTAEDAAPVDNIIPPTEQVTESIYKILDTNIAQITLSRMRDSVWTSDPEWLASKQIPVKKDDVILITSSGEVSTEEKKLYVQFISEGINGQYNQMMVGYDVQFYDRIGKPW